jgi:hypothetical protein
MHANRSTAKVHPSRSAKSQPAEQQSLKLRVDAYKSSAFFKQAAQRKFN